MIYYKKIKCFYDKWYNCCLTRNENDTACKNWIHHIKFIFFSFTILWRSHYSNHLAFTFQLQYNSLYFHPLKNVYNNEKKMFVLKIFDLPSVSKLIATMFCIPLYRANCTQETWNLHEKCLYVAGNNQKITISLYNILFLTQWKLL